MQHSANFNIIAVFHYEKTLFNRMNWQSVRRIETRLLVRLGMGTTVIDHNFNFTLTLNISLLCPFHSIVLLQRKLT